MISTRKHVTAWALGLAFIVMGSATAAHARVKFQVVGSGEQDDSMFVTVTHRSPIARPTDATVTESPVQLRAERQTGTMIPVPAPAPVVVSKPAVAVVETADGRLLQHPKYLAPPRAASTAMPRTTSELLQLREENQLLKKLVKKLSRPPTARRIDATPQPLPRASTRL